MKAVVARKYGAVCDVVEIADVPVPSVGPHDVLIQVRAAGVNLIDSRTVKGFLQPPLPRVLGNEVAGVALAVGIAVNRVAVGDHVFARLDPHRGGAFAQAVAADESLVAIKPTKVSFVEAASLPMAALTAWQALVEQADVRVGQRVLVHGGSGGVGSAAVQIAKFLGATVISTATGPGLQQVMALGVDQAVDYRTQDFVEVVDKVDVVLDTVGGDVQARSFRVLRAGGKLVSTVGIPDQLEEECRWRVRARSFFSRPDGDQLAQIADLMQCGKLKAVVGLTLPLTDVVAALQRVAQGGTNGKVVLTVLG